jgi:hypothetical protein
MDRGISQGRPQRRAAALKVAVQGFEGSVTTPPGAVGEMELCCCEARHNAAGQQIARLQAQLKDHRRHLYYQVGDMLDDCRVMLADGHDQVMSTMIEDLRDIVGSGCVREDMGSGYQEQNDHPLTYLAYTLELSLPTTTALACVDRDTLEELAQKVARQQTRMTEAEAETQAKLENRSVHGALPKASVSTGGDSGKRRKPRQPENPPLNAPSSSTGGNPVKLEPVALSLDRADGDGASSDAPCVSLCSSESSNSTVLASDESEYDKFMAEYDLRRQSDAGKEMMGMDMTKINAVEATATKIHKAAEQKKLTDASFLRQPGKGTEAEREKGDRARLTELLGRSRVSSRHPFNPTGNTGYECASCENGGEKAMERIPETVEDKQAEAELTHRSVESCRRRTYLEVPHGEKELAKAYGAKWDPQRRKWFADSEFDLPALTKWLPCKFESIEAKQAQQRHWNPPRGQHYREDDTVSGSPYGDD